MSVGLLSYQWIFPIRVKSNANDLTKADDLKKNFDSKQMILSKADDLNEKLIDERRRS